MHASKREGLILFRTSKKHTIPQHNIINMSSTLPKLINKFIKKQESDQHHEKYDRNAKDGSIIPCIDLFPVNFTKDTKKDQKVKAVIIYL